MMRKLLTVSISAIAGMVLSFAALADADFESATFYNKMKITRKAYVNTGYAPNGGTIVRAKYSPSDTANACLYCARLSTSRNKDNPDFTFFVAVNSKLRFDYYTNAYPGTKNISANAVYELEVKDGTAIVEGLNMHKKAVRRSERTQGGLVEMEFPIQLCKLMPYDAESKKGSRVAVTEKDGKKALKLKASGKTVDFTWKKGV